MKLKLSIIYLSLLPLAISFSCSTSNPTAKNSTSTNITVENRLANKDFSNKPVNLNNQKDKEKCDKQIEELNKSRDLWKEQNISDYDFVCEAFNPSMIVFSPVLIKVRGNQTVSVEETFQSDVYKHFSYEKVNSFEKMFDFIQKQLENGSFVSFKYNKKFGYPESWGVGYSFAEHDSNSFKISKFEKIR